MKSHGVVLDFAGNELKNFPLIEDASGTTSIDSENRVLEDSVGSTSLDWQNRIGKGSDGASYLSWEAGNVYLGDLPDSGVGLFAIDVTNAQLIYGSVTVGWASGILYDTLPNVSVNWFSRYLVNLNNDIIYWDGLTYDSSLAILNQGGSSNTLIVKDDSGDTLFNITASGEVGIGLDAPTYQLEILGSGEFAGIYVTSNDYIGVPSPGTIYNSVVINPVGINLTYDGTLLTGDFPCIGMGVALNREGVAALGLKNANGPYTGPALLIEEGFVALRTTGFTNTIFSIQSPDSLPTGFAIQAKNYDDLELLKIQNDGATFLNGDLDIGGNNLINFGYIQNGNAFKAGVVDGVSIVDFYPISPGQYSIQQLGTSVGIFAPNLGFQSTNFSFASADGSDTYFGYFDTEGYFISYKDWVFNGQITVNGVDSGVAALFVADTVGRGIAIIERADSVNGYGIQVNIKSDEGNLYNELASYSNTHDGTPAELNIICTEIILSMGSYDSTIIADDLTTSRTYQLPDIDGSFIVSGGTNLLTGDTQVTGNGGLYYMEFGYSDDSLSKFIVNTNQKVDIRSLSGTEQSRFILDTDDDDSATWLYTSNDFSNGSQIRINGDQIVLEYFDNDSSIDNRLLLNSDGVIFQNSDGHEAIFDLSLMSYDHSYKLPDSDGNILVSSGYNTLTGYTAIDGAYDIQIGNGTKLTGFRVNTGDSGQSLFNADDGIQYSQAYVGAASGWGLQYSAYSTNNAFANIYGSSSDLQFSYYDGTTTEHNAVLNSNGFGLSDDLSKFGYLKVDNLTTSRTLQLPDSDGTLALLSDVAPAPITQTSDYTFVLTDLNQSFEFNKSTAITATIPANASVAFPLGTIIYLAQSNTGQLTVAPDSGVTLVSADSYTKLRVKDSVAYIQKIGTDTWRLVGDLKS